MKLIMVDLDGTLFDTKRINYLAYREAMAPFGYELEEDYFYEFCNGKHYLDFLPRITTNDMQILSQIHMKKKDLYRRYLDVARVNLALVELLRICKRSCKIALVTTASKDNTFTILHYFKLKDLFDLVLTGDEVKRKKPDPEGFLRAMSTFRVSAKESIIFEDSDVGIEAASRAGVACFSVIGFN